MTLTLITTATDTVIPATYWWDDQPVEVRAVFDIANMADDSARDRVAALVAPAHVDTIANLAHELQVIERLGYDDASSVLSDLLGRPVRGSTLDEYADELADSMRREAITTAQLVASLVVRGGRR